MHCTTKVPKEPEDDGVRDQRVLGAARFGASSRPQEEDSKAFERRKFFRQQKVLAGQSECFTGAHALNILDDEDGDKAGLSNLG